MFGSVKHQQWILFPTVSVYHSLPLPLFLCLCVHYACVRVSVCLFVFVCVCLFSLLWKVDWSQGSFCFSTFVASLSWAFKSASAVTGFKVENFRDRKCSLYTKAITTTSIQNKKVQFFWNRSENQKIFQYKFYVLYEQIRLMEKFSNCWISKWKKMFSNKSNSSSFYQSIRLIKKP